MPESFPGGRHVLFLSLRVHFTTIWKGTCACVSPQNECINCSITAAICFSVTCFNCFNGVLVVAHIICAAVCCFLESLCASVWLAPSVTLLLCQFSSTIRLYSPFIKGTLPVFSFFFLTTITTNQKYFTSQWRHFANHFAVLLRGFSTAIPSSHWPPFISMQCENEQLADSSNFQFSV